MLLISVLEIFPPKICLGSSALHFLAAPVTPLALARMTLMTSKLPRRSKGNPGFKDFVELDFVSPA